MEKDKSFVIYHKYIPKVGGIESAVYNLGKKLDKEGYKVTIVFDGVESSESLYKYAEVGDVVKLTADTKINTNICLIASNHDIPLQITANKFFQWVHSDYDKYKLDLKNKGKVQYVAVSKHCKKVIERREDIKAEVIYNLLDDDFGTDKRRVLRLVSNTRVSPEKGFGRMYEFASMLKERGIRFVWVIYGDNSYIVKEYNDWINTFRPIEEVQFVGFKRNIEIGLTNCDYLVQLSNFEGCPYSVLEAQKLGIPCIVTKWGGVEELITDGENGYILPMDMKLNDKVIDNIINNIPIFEPREYSSIQDWIKLIGD